jgi:hypothetical protein
MVLSAPLRTSQGTYWAVSNSTVIIRPAAQYGRHGYRRSGCYSVRGAWIVIAEHVTRA